MTENNYSIENIRIDAIAEIKEKIKKNPKYLHPCNKERQEDMKRLKFANGYELTCWMQQNRIMKNPIKTRRNELEEWVKDKGFDSYNKYRKTLNSQKGEYLRKYCREYYQSKGHYSMSESIAWVQYFGVHIGEELYKKFLEEVIFEYVENTEYHDGGIDFLCKNPRQEFIDKYPQFKLIRGKEYRIQLNMRCLSFNPGNRIRWEFQTRWNNVVDIFILSAWDDRISLQPIHTWLFHKDDIIRGRKFYKREKFTITDRPEYIKEFEKHELIDELKILKKLCEDMET